MCLSGNAQKTGMLGQGLDIDLLPGLATGIGEAIAVIRWRLGVPRQGSRKYLGIAQSGQLIDQQGTVDVERGIERNNQRRGAGLALCAAASHLAGFTGHILRNIDDTEQTATQIDHAEEPWLRTELCR